MRSRRMRYTLDPWRKSEGALCIRVTQAFRRLWGRSRSATARSVHPRTRCLRSCVEPCRAVVDARDEDGHRRSHVRPSSSDRARTPSLKCSSASASFPGGSPLSFDAQWEESFEVLTWRNSGCIRAIRLAILYRSFDRRSRLRRSIPSVSRDRGDARRPEPMGLILLKAGTLMLLVVSLNGVANFVAIRLTLALA